MGRERKKLERVSHVRDARLFVIATEGEETEFHIKVFARKNFYMKNSILKI